jgi:gas vesicle protein
MGERSSGFGDFLTGLLVGGAIGYAIALLNAPRPGEETRAMLEEKGRELRSRATETVHTTVDKTGKMVAEGRDVLNARVEETRSLVQERVSDLKNRGEAVVSDVRAQVGDTLHTVASEVEPSGSRQAGSESKPQA